MKYAYPAIFHPEENGGYSVEFVDLPQAYTCGDDMADAIFMAEDVLALTLVDMEESGKAIPKPSNVSKISASNGDFVSMVAVNTTIYREKINPKYIRKNCTVPEWLSVQAENAGINFSQALQKALKQELDIAE